MIVLIDSPLPTTALRVHELALQLCPRFAQRRPSSNKNLWMCEQRALQKASDWRLPSLQRNWPNEVMQRHYCPDFVRWVGGDMDDGEGRSNTTYCGYKMGIKSSDCPPPRNPGQLHLLPFFSSLSTFLLFNCSQKLLCFVRLIVWNT